jgi:hypothetical protein
MKKYVAWAFVVLLILIPMWGVDIDVTPKDGNEVMLCSMVCCRCISYLSNGKRFYHGIIPIENCLKEGGHCEGEAPCFPK